MEFEKKIEGYIRRHSLLTPGDCVVVGLSGGADSVALLAVLSALGYKCIAAHCNFNLRGDESLRDRDHAIAIADNLAAESRVIDFDTEAYRQGTGESIEMACRSLRYRWFEQLRVLHNAVAIAVGHHREDNVETAMLNMLRGTGIAGMAGIAPKSGHIVRPLLEVTRPEICRYLQQRGLHWVDDSSNASNDYKRNRLRNVVLPTVAREFGPESMASLAASVGNVRQNYELYRTLVDDALAVFGDASRLDVTALLKRYGHDNGTMLLVEYLRPHGFVADVAYNIVTAVTQRHTGLQFIGTQKNTAMLDRGILTIGGANPQPEGDTVAEIHPNRISTVDVPQVGISISIEEHDAADFIRPRRPDASVLYLDAAITSDDTPLTLRHWRHGDRIKPFGAPFTTLVSDIFSDAKLSANEKQRVLLLCHGDTILWVVGLKNSSHYPVTNQTQRYFRLKATNM